MSAIAIKHNDEVLDLVTAAEMGVTGEEIELDTDGHLLQLNVSEEILNERKLKWIPYKNEVKSKWLKRYQLLVSNASNGAVLKTEL